MKNIFLSLTLVVLAFPVVGHAAIMDEATVAMILGTRMPPSEVRVGTSMKPLPNSVRFFDNLINVTNRVLNRSIRADIVRVYTNSQNGEIYTSSAVRNKEAVQTHCRSRLIADGVENAITECSLSM